VAALTLLTLASCTGTQTEERTTLAFDLDPSRLAERGGHSVRPAGDRLLLVRASVRRCQVHRPSRRTNGTPSQPVGGARLQVLIDREQASVFEYPTEKELAKVRSSVSPRGDQIPTADVRRCS
jgi:hypothetical protein